MNENKAPRRQNLNRRRYGFLPGAIVGFLILYVFAKSQGFVDDRALSVGVLGAAAGGVGGLIGARWGPRGAFLGITLGTLGAIAGSYLWYLLPQFNQ